MCEEFDESKGSGRKKIVKRQAQRLDNKQRKSWEGNLPTNGARSVTDIISMTFEPSPNDPDNSHCECLSLFGNGQKNAKKLL